MAQVQDQEEAAGWKAIDEALQPIYKDQEPLHYAPQQPFSLGGSDPLDGISAYKSDTGIPHWHFVTYGMSELYGKQSDILDQSGYGMEFTFRLARSPQEEAPPAWVFDFLQHMARYVVQTGNTLDVGHRMGGNGPITAECQTQIHAVAFIRDSQLGDIQTPHGLVRFLQIVGVTEDELTTMQAWTTEGFLAVLAQENSLLVTDMHRKSLLSDPAKASAIQALMKSAAKGKKGLFGRFFS